MTRNADLARGALEVGADGFPDDESQFDTCEVLVGRDYDDPVRCDEPADTAYVCERHLRGIDTGKLPGACDPRNLAYLTGVAARLADITTKIGAGHGRWARRSQRRDAHEAALRTLETGERIRIADELNPETGKPLYGNEFKREAALAEWKLDNEEAGDHQEEIDKLTQEIDLVQSELDQLAMERVNLLSESRLAAAWLQFASTAQEDR